MLDFTSSLYLGFTHPISTLPSWPRLTEGVPAALRVNPLQHDAERELAQLAGTERAMLAPSSLHLFWDLFGQPLKRYSAVLIEDGSYEIARWGAARASARGVKVIGFDHHSADSLERKLATIDGEGRPVVVADGFCTGCGRTPPLADYLRLASARNGLLLIDDTQAVGAIGVACGTRPGGGGCLAQFGRRRPHLLVVASLAKAFGVPAAFVAGDAAWIERIERNSDTRLHCSPPSACDIYATLRALALNRRCGDALRWRLSARVAAFRRAIAAFGVAPLGGGFPVQTLMLREIETAPMLYRQLLRGGVRVVLRRIACASAVGLSFVLTVRHSLADIARAVRVLAAALSRQLHSHWERHDDRFNGSVWA